MCGCATAEGGVVYTLSSTICTCEYASQVSHRRDHKVNIPPQSSLSSFLQKETKISEAVQSTDEKSQHNRDPADSSLVGNNSLFLEGLRRDLVADITKYFKQLDDPSFVPGRRTFPMGMSLARGGRSLEVGKFEKELEDALLSTQAGSINVSYWMNNWPSIEECLELLPLDPVPLVSTALMPTDKGIE